MVSTAPAGQTKDELKRSLGLFDSTMIVAGCLIGTGIFLVSAEMARQVGSAGVLLASWIVSALLTVGAALAYGELAAMMPRGRRPVCLPARSLVATVWLFVRLDAFSCDTGRHDSRRRSWFRPLSGNSMAAHRRRQLPGPAHPPFLPLPLSLSAGQLVGVLMITLLTWINSRGIQWGKVVKNCFTSAKLAALLAVIVVGIFLGWNAQAVRANFSHPWTPQEVAPLAPGLSLNTAFGLLVAMCVAQVGSMFAADAWNNITFTAGEVTNPRRNLPLSLAFGTFIVMGLYFCANIAYLVVLPLAQVQHAPSDRVAGAVLQRVFPAFGGGLMAATIMVSAFGCANGKVLTGARAYYIMARDGLFFRRAAALNRAQVPGAALIMQGIWASLLVLIRTYEPSTATSLSFSQTSTTVLAGTVYDPSDAVVIGATVTALNVATGVSLKQPGVTQKSGTGINVNGLRSAASNVTIDGIEANESSNPAAANNVFRINPDNVEEFKVTTANPTAEEGRNSSMNVSIATRSGTNQFHFAALDYFRNRDLNSNSFYGNAQNLPRAHLNANQYGFDVSGPIRKNKTFFYEAWQGQRVDGTVWRRSVLGARSASLYSERAPGWAFFAIGSRILRTHWC